MLLRQITYISVALTPLSAQDMAALLHQSRRNNADQGITGMMLFSSGFFAQLIEGESATVGALYQRIQSDSRHIVLRCLADLTIHHRLYPDWSMGFHHIPQDQRSCFRQIRQLLKTEIKNPSAARQFMRKFIENIETV